MRCIRRLRTVYDRAVNRRIEIVNIEIYSRSFIVGISLGFYIYKRALGSLGYTEACVCKLRPLALCNFLCVYLVLVRLTVRPVILESEMECG